MTGATKFSSLPAQTVSIPQRFLGRAYYGKGKCILNQIESLGVKTKKVDATRGCQPSIQIFGSPKAAKDAADIIKQNLEVAYYEADLRKSKRDEKRRVNRELRLASPELPKKEQLKIASVNKFGALDSFDSHDDEPQTGGQTVWRIVNQNGDIELVGEIPEDEILEPVDADNGIYKHKEFGIIEIDGDMARIPFSESSNPEVVQVNVPPEESPKNSKSRRREKRAAQQAKNQSNKLVIHETTREIVPCYLNHSPNHKPKSFTRSNSNMNTHMNAPINSPITSGPVDWWE